MDDLFHSLPKRLQDKICPPPKETVDQRIEKAVRYKKMESSISPAKYRRSSAGGPSGVRGAAGDHPPTTNRGVTSSGAVLPSFEAREHLQIVPIGSRGRYEAIRIPGKNKSFSGRHSFVDWVSFTFKIASFNAELKTGHQALTNDDIVTALSGQLFDVFGFGCSEKRKQGANFYQESWELGQHGWGMVCIGGQRETVLVMVKGQGLMAAKPGWEQRLHDLLLSIPEAKLTRVDLAHDDFNSAVSIDDYFELYKAGLFANRGRNPSVECVGDWHNKTEKGRTLYVGSRDSGKLLRIYEKGKQIAKGYHEKFPNWIRVELELKNDARIIPLDALLCPGQYLAGAYPALARLFKTQERITTFKKSTKSTWLRAIEITKTQFGRYIWVFSEIFGAEKAVKLLTDGKDQVPKTLNCDTWQEFEEEFYIHMQNPNVFKDVIPLNLPKKEAA